MILLVSSEQIMFKFVANISPGAMRHIIYLFYNIFFACFYKLSNVRRYINLYWTFQCWLSCSHNMALLFKQWTSCLWFATWGQTTITCSGPAFKTQYLLFFSTGMKLKEHLIKGWHIHSQQPFIQMIKFVWNRLT